MSQAQAVFNEAEWDACLVRAGAKVRAKIEKYLAVFDAAQNSAYTAIWRRLACRMAMLAPLPMQPSGAKGWRFFTPDRQYRRQVFAMAEGTDGTIQVYLPNVIQEAVKAHILAKTKDPSTFAVPGTSATLLIEALDAANTPNPEEHFKHMLGWNRKALRLTIPTAPPLGEKEMAAVDALLTSAKDN